jgi:hypothetical protein
MAETLRSLVSMTWKGSFKPFQPLQLFQQIYCFEQLFLDYGYFRIKPI